MISLTFLGMFILEIFTGKIKYFDYFYVCHWKAYEMQK